MASESSFEGKVAAVGVFLIPAAFAFALAITARNSRIPSRARKASRKKSARRGAVRKLPAAGACGGAP